MTISLLRIALSSVSGGSFGTILTKDKQMIYHTSRYEKLIEIMARDLDDSGEMPSRYTDEFREAAAEILSGKFRLDVPDLSKEARLFIDYIKNSDDPDIRPIKAVEICEAMVEKIIKYYRDDIENDVEQLHKRKYSKVTTYESCDQIPHCG